MKTKSLVTTLGLTLALGVGVITTSAIAATELTVSDRVTKAQSSEDKATGYNSMPRVILASKEGDELEEEFIKHGYEG